MKTTFIVSGYMRTGTSMMMRALVAGGLAPIYNKARDRMNRQYGDKHYQPNKDGFYELSRQEYRQFGFPRMYQGKLLKCMYGGLWQMVVGDYKVVFMMRDPEEIRQSFEAFFSRPLPPMFKRYKEVMGDTIEMLKNRKDTQVDIFEYREVISDPLRHFKLLKAHGWPIDIIRAAKIVDPKKIRFKKENLTIGI